MVVVSYSGREINAKIVYYGPGLSGKTTNLEKIYDSVPETNRGRMVSMKTQTDRTLFFDLLPLDLGELQGMKTRLLLYTVPGQVYYNATRKLVLKGVDAVVFVAVSAPDKMAENRESFTNLELNLKAYGIDIRIIPLVIQLNKRDLPNAMPVEDMNRELNRLNVPWFEAQAANGAGVFETLRGVSKLLLAKITKDVLEKDKGAVQGLSRAKSAAAKAQAAPARQSAAVAAPPPPPVARDEESVGDFEREGSQISSSQARVSAVGSGDARRVSIPIELGSLPRSGRVTLTVEISIQIDSDDARPKLSGGKKHAGLDDSFTRDLEPIPQPFFRVT